MQVRLLRGHLGQMKEKATLLLLLELLLHVEVVSEPTTEVAASGLRAPSSQKSVHPGRTAARICKASRRKKSQIQKKLIVLASRDSRRKQ